MRRLPDSLDTRIMKLIQVTQTGGPEQLKYVDGSKPAPGPKQALVKIAAAGVNFIDVYHRTGLYKLDLPFTPGMEAAGTVEEVGPDAGDLKPGDRVAYAMNRGSYAEYAVVPAAILVKLPDGVSFETGAAAMLQGMTAHYLTHSTFPLKTGDTCPIHAAAGGVGRLAVQMAKMLGARVIGTAGNADKVALARSAGADEVINYTEQDFLPEVKRLTNGRGVDVVYDSVGVATFLKGLDCIRSRGMMVLFGQSSGPVAPIDPNILNPKGSLFLTRPNLAPHCATREELTWRAGDVLGWIAAGKLELRIDRTFPLAQAKEAQQDLEGRKTAGKVLLTP
jgi:NADPH2:quinone reductase